MKKVISIITGLILLLFMTSCRKTEIQTQGKEISTINSSSAISSSTANINGISSAIPAYYDAIIHTIIFVEFSPTAEATQIAHNKSINFIYQSDNGLPNNLPFISVIDAIPGGGFNPVWREVQIVFNSGFTPRQLYSDNEVLAAASGTNPEITLNLTNEVYYCPVIGHQ